MFLREIREIHWNLGKKSIENLTFSDEKFENFLNLLKKFEKIVKTNLKFSAKCVVFKENLAFREIREISRNFAIFSAKYALFFAK